MKNYYFSFLFIRLFTLPVLLMPYRWVHAVGKLLGTFSYYLFFNFRKRALSNLSLASDLNLSESEIKKIAKLSFQNLITTCLEYPKLSFSDDLDKIATCLNPEKATSILKSGKGVIFFCGHQSNWEILFLEGTKRMPGVAIGRPIENPILYDWVLSIRQKFGGKIIAPQNAIREGLRALKQNKFLGIVGDQGMPGSGYSSPFFGRRAWTSPVPAILSYRTGCPILVATTLREKGKYIIHYSDPIWPNQQETMESEVDRMMKKALALLEESIKKAPGQWLWQHNRWKQAKIFLKETFRQEAVCIILPQDKEQLEELSPHLNTFKEIYPLEFLTFFVPKDFADISLPEDSEKILYADLKEVLVRDFRFKLVFNFTPFKKVRLHFLLLSAFRVISLADLKRRAKAKPCDTFSDILKKAILPCHMTATL